MMTFLREPHRATALALLLGMTGAATAAALPLGDAPADARAHRASAPPRLSLSDLFETQPRMGLRYTPRAQQLDGVLVEVSGYMVQQSRPQWGRYLLAQRPLRLLDAFGPADDLPPGTLLVQRSPRRSSVVRFDERPQLLRGVLRLGPAPLAEGGVAWATLLVDGEEAPLDPAAAQQAPAAQVLPAMQESAKPRAAATSAAPGAGAPRVTRLTPPSGLFSTGEAGQPVTARFLPGQRFDLQATIQLGAGQALERVRFFIGDAILDAPVTLNPLDASRVSAACRAVSVKQPGLHTFRVEALQRDGQTASASGNLEIAPVGESAAARNVIVLIGDGMGIAHRTAARLMLHGAAQGKSRGRLAMDTMPVTGLVMTASLNSIVTDSSPGAAAYCTGNKSNNNQQGVFPDDTPDPFDNPRVELLPEFLHRTTGALLGIVTTADVFDATPGAWGTHTANRGAGAGICDQYLDEAVAASGLRVLMGGGRKWFLPAPTPGSARGDGRTDYQLPQDLADRWSVPRGAIDPQRDLLAAFQEAGFHYVADATELRQTPAATQRLLGSFALSNMNVALDKIAGRRGDASVVAEYGFPDQPMLDEMTAAALRVLESSGERFVLMVEAASIDKQAHNMDTERWILDTIELDRAVQTCLNFARRREDTLVIVTADHECGGANIIGASIMSNQMLTLASRAAEPAIERRHRIVGVYDNAGFPRYAIAPDGYPETTDVDGRMLMGYAANADRYEDWLTNPLPMRDPQQPFNNRPPLSTYPASPLQRDAGGGLRLTGHVADVTAVHTASDVPLSAEGPGSQRFTGVMDNTDVFFKIARAMGLGGE